MSLRGYIIFWPLIGIDIGSAGFHFHRCCKDRVVFLYDAALLMNISNDILNPHYTLVIISCAFKTKSL